MKHQSHPSVLRQQAVLPKSSLNIFHPGTATAVQPRLRCPRAATLRPQVTDETKRHFSTLASDLRALSRVTAAAYKKSNSCKTEHNADLKSIYLYQKLPGGSPENTTHRGKHVESISLQKSSTEGADQHTKNRKGLQDKMKINYNHYFFNHQSCTMVGVIDTHTELTLCFTNHFI